MNKIIISSLSKKYGSKTILNDISLQIETGVFGLFGKNGAGKSTLLRILAGILPQSSGSVFVNDIDIADRDAIRAVTGYLPQEFAFYPNFTSFEVLEYCAGLSGVKSREIREKAEAALADVHLTGQRKVRFSKLSGGMKRRLGFAQTILHDPNILIFDEPFTGIDTVEKAGLCALIERLSADKIVIISTHAVSDVEHLCGRIGILHNGELAFNGEIAELKPLTAAESLEEAYLRIVNGELK